MTVLPPDYDTDPDRWGSRNPAWRLAADAHEMVAARVVLRQPSPLLDVGSGRGRLREVLPVGWPVRLNRRTEAGGIHDRAPADMTEERTSEQ